MTALVVRGMQGWDARWHFRNWMVA